MQHIEGDLVELSLRGEFDIIVHGCNCFHEMSAGIAKPIGQAFPEAVEVDRETPHGSQDKLGTISTATVTRGDVTLTVVNAYTQHHWQGSGRLVDYDAVTSCFECVAERFPTARIGYPRIGAGLAGGEWDEVSSRIDDALDGMTHTVVLLPG